MKIFDARLAQYFAAARSLVGILPRVLICVLLLSPNAFANEVKVFREKQTFTVSVLMPVAAPLASARAVMSELDAYDRLHHAITESWVDTPPPEFQPRMHTRITGCIWYFCKKLKWTGKIKELGPGHWRASAESDKTSISHGDSEWGVRADNEASEFFFESSFTVSFWVPPIIGDWLVKRKLTNEMKELVVNIENYANGEEKDENEK